MKDTKLRISCFSSFERNRDGPDRERDAPRERPRLNLQPRSKPVENAAPAPAPDSGKQAGSDKGIILNAKNGK